MVRRKTIVIAIALVALGVAALLWLPIEDNTTIRNAVTIARDPDTVFAYVTTPGNWPKWHPASKAVSGATDHSLELGERVTEDFVVAGRTGRVVWTVAKRDSPREWIIEGDVDGRKAGVITYSLTAVAEGTRFERQLIYPSPNLLFAMLNRVSIRSRIEQESDQAVRNLKRVLENPT
jgi:uncharacterized protein YndB with AHSA1/START domain